MQSQIMPPFIRAVLLCARRLEIRSLSLWLSLHLSYDRFPIICAQKVNIAAFFPTIYSDPLDSGEKSLSFSSKLRLLFSSCLFSHSFLRPHRPNSPCLSPPSPIPRIPVSHVTLPISNPLHPLTNPPFRRIDGRTPISPTPLRLNSFGKHPQPSHLLPACRSGRSGSDCERTCSR